MTWRELFAQLSAADDAAFAAGDTVQMRQIVVARGLFATQYQELAAPDRDEEVPEAIVRIVTRAQMPDTFGGTPR